ncbi:hypothetical protein GPDM_06785 [Planococcus donghaensis MPA1U2]|uniref:Uncharacterized protein n=1 Tax=Planococcus donghaensis MPA1U2 TaxID=933115 RepID=E7RFV9_9BACL|nr:hypothetical protein [Planococcus donghaensis]EGA90229.1 hypothetical protein GPDM_06785 [Planococcus donghaensis MPA1U2]
MKINIQPTKTQLQKWIEIYVPEKDLFFIQEEDLPLFDEELGHALLIPRDEFFNHASYKQIQLANSYEYWNLSKEVYSVIVATENWITELPPSKKERLLQIQLKVNRGLIFPLSYFSELPLFLKENVVIEKEEKLIVMTADLWKRMSMPARDQLLRKYAQQWGEWASEETPEHLPLVVKKYANTFPTEGGSNCLAATLFAISRQEWMIHEWVHPQTFKEMLGRTHRLIQTEEWIEGDVVIWQTAEGQIQHASYHIGNELFFNKNGQTFFNPWKITRFDELQAEWREYSLKTYRLQ